jgi:3-hydroxyisobutyrate dehydrogenase
MNPFTPLTTQIGWIGTGVMGASMCRHLIEAGYATTVYNRTREKAEPLLQLGAAWADSPRSVAEQADVVFTIVGFPKDVREVILGEEGVLAGMKSGGVVVDMTTSEPSLAIEIAERAAAENIVAIDAPVSGGDLGARNGTLSIMIGGDRAAVQALAPCWDAMGSTCVWQGGPGAGQHTKLTNQILIASNMIGVCEGLLYAHRAGLDLEQVMKSVASGAAGSWSLTNLGKRMIANDFDPGFFVEHFIKDMGIALDECRRMGLELPGLSLAEELYLKLAATGHLRSGTQALILALAEMSGVDWQGR